jgi:hypothetical protein
MRHGTVKNFFIIAVIFISFTAVYATEPVKPDVDHIFNFEQEAKINKVISLTPEKAFEHLKGVDFLINDDFLHKAIFKTFGHRKKVGIDLALSYLTLPETEMINGQLVHRADDFYVAKKVLEVFPGESVSKLLKLYKSGNAITKGNIIRSSGQIAGGKVIKDMLVRALDNKTICEEETPEMDGEPLRICDVAYNQLVLRYKVKNVLRTIGNGYRIEVRDYHIDVLKNKL